MANHIASMTAARVYEERSLLKVHNIDPASGRANHSHPWELATYLNQIAGKGRRVPVVKRPYVRREMEYTYGSAL